MELTVIGAIFGGMISWIISHWYYKESVRFAKRENPLPLLEELSNEIRTINEHIKSPSYISPESHRFIKEASDKSSLLIAKIHHIYRWELQHVINLIDELVSLDKIKTSGKISDIVKELDEWAKMINKNITSSINPSLE